MRVFTVFCDCVVNKIVSGKKKKKKAIYTTMYVCKMVCGSGTGAVNCQMCKM